MLQHTASLISVEESVPYARRRWLALAVFTVWSVAGALAVHVGADVLTSAGQHRFVRVTLPDDDSASRRDIEVLVGHQPPVPLNPDQPIDLATAGSVSLTFKSSSGLTLTTTATETEQTITLPALSSRRFAVNDSYGQAIQGAIIGLRGGAGRFVWTTSAVTSLEGTVSILVPRASSGVVALVEATGFGSRGQEVTLGGDTTTIALEASATVAMLLTDKSRQLEAAAVELWNVTGSRTTSRTPAQ